MFYVGIDVHTHVSMVCILNTCGAKIKSATIRGRWPKLIEFLLMIKMKYKQELAICFEASTGYGWLHEKLITIASQIQVAHPGQLRLIFKSKKKSDRVDAEKLAKLLFIGEVPPVYVPEQDVRSWRSLIEHRVAIVNERSRIKNRLRAMLRNFCIEKPQTIKSIWTKKGIHWLAEIKFPTDVEDLQRDLMLADLQSKDEMIDRVEKVLKNISDNNTAVELLMSIPGVGIRTAETMVAYIDNPQRFKSIKKIGAYFGLVPCEDSSAGKQRLGHITREGPTTARKMLTEAAWQSVRRSLAMKNFFRRVAQGKKERRKVALVAVGHKLLRVMLAILKTGERWSEEKILGSLVRNLKQAG